MRPDRLQRTIPLASRTDRLRQPGTSTDKPSATSSASDNGEKVAGAWADVHIIPASHVQDVSAVSGPALTAGDSEPPPANRHRPKPAVVDRGSQPNTDRPRTMPAPPDRSSSLGSVDDRTAYRTPGRYSTATDAQGVSEAHEPAPFRPDPFATPAPSTHSDRNDRTASAAAPDSGFGESSLEGEGTGQPGNPQLDGVQTPQLAIHKSAPKEIQVGKPAVFRVTVRNTGLVPAAHVEIHDRVPRGTRLLGTSPQAKHDSNGELVWTLGTIRAGEEAFVEMQLMPTAEGEIGSVATVHFGADASVRTVATRPQLALKPQPPARCSSASR